MQLIADVLSALNRYTIQFLDRVTWLNRYQFSLVCPSIHLIRADLLIILFVALDFRILFN